MVSKKFQTYISKTQPNNHVDTDTDMLAYRTQLVGCCRTRTVHWIILAVYAYLLVRVSEREREISYGLDTHQHRPAPDCGWRQSGMDTDKPSENRQQRATGYLINSVTGLLQ